MKPIRIYSDYQEQIVSPNYYLWRNKRICRGGGGCADGCVFYRRGLMAGCTALDIMPSTVQTYQPDSGYVELTIDTHPEVFL